MPTLRDVAKHANVSPSTVSSMLNNRASLRLETRKRIERAISELGYTHRTVGRPKAASRSRCAALVVPHSQNDDVLKYPIQRRRINSIRRAIAASGDQISFFAGIPKVENNMLLQESIDDGHVDGVLLSSPTQSDGYIDWLAKRNIPMVVLGRIPEHYQYSFVCRDDYLGGSQVAEYLINLGHQQLGFLEPERTYFWNKLREQGFRDRARLLDASVFPTELYDRTATKASKIKSIKSLLKQGVTAVFTTNDGIAIEVLNLLESMGVSVPEDLSVVGFDDMGYTDKKGRKPCSVYFDIESSGVLAVEYLWRLVDPNNRFSHFGACIKTEMRAYDTSGYVNR